MAFSVDKSEENAAKSNNWLLDQSLMQDMQDRFCDANNVYMVCLNAQNGVVTKAYGSKEELEYVHSKGIPMKKTFQVEQQKNLLEMLQYLTNLLGKRKERETGLEPAAPTLARSCSTN